MSDDRSPGWDAITAEFERIYPGQTDPKHYGTLIKYRLGGNDPLDGISIYDGGSYWHFVTYGLSELYEKETDDHEYSGYGYEMTLKLKKMPSVPSDYEEAEIKNICGILQTIARITFKSGEIFCPDEFIRTGQPEGIDVQHRSAITGFICISDPSVNTLKTPFGEVSFLELIGATEAELKTLGTRASVREFYKKLGSDVTDYGRISIV